LTENPETPDDVPQRPEPADQGARREPSPFQQPKPAEDDPDAPARVRRIMDSPSYRLAAADPDFLRGDDTRGLRLLLDYLKPELALQRHGVTRTIVVFGSTRICEPAAARRRVDEAGARLDAAGGPQAAPELAEKLDIAERILARSHYYDEARAFCRLVAEANAGAEPPTTLVMTGGGPGIMEAANRGAFDAGAKTIGLNISLPLEQQPNSFITPELCFQFHYFAIRKFHFLLRAMALVVFPGGYGTLDEMFEVLTLRQTGRMQHIPVILVGREYWERVIDFQFLADEGTIADADLELFRYVETAEEAWEIIQKFHHL
jgi:uncharacterized protein (TIGR00730 family)